MKNVLVAVTGGIACYKTPEIVRRLPEHGIAVRVVMTSSACEFIKPLVFQAVSGHSVHTELLDDQAEAGMGHIELARWADVVVVAPATANTLAKMAAGLADDLLSTVCLATTARQIVAPAMNSMMWHHPATVSNVATLESRGVLVLGPGQGEQACGETGVGRMLEPADIVQSILNLDTRELVRDSLVNRRVMITAGPTREAIDPVRFISNHSSGKMGFAMSHAANLAGAKVTLIAGPVSLPTPQGVSRVDVQSAAEMHDAVMHSIDETDIFIAVAAVADYRVVNTSTTKMKKTDAEVSLNLQRNPDILAAVSSLKRRPMCVGFAAETDNLEKYATTKLQKKKLDIIVANRVGIEGNGFNSDQNAVEVFWPGGSQSFSSRSKQRLAFELIQLIAARHSSK